MQQTTKKQTISAIVSLMMLLASFSVNSYGQPAANAAALKHKVDTSITNKTAAKSITPQAVGGRLKDILDWALVNVDTGGTSGDLDHVLNNGNFSLNSLYLGKGGTSTNAQLRLVNDTSAGGNGELSTNDATNAKWARLKMSAGWPLVQIHVSGEDIYMASDNAVAGVQGGLTSDHISGNGPAPTAIKYGATGDRGNPATVDGSDLAGIITFTTGTTPVGSYDTILRLTFNHPYLFRPKYGVIAAADSATARFLVSSSVFIPAVGLTPAICYIVLAGNVLTALSTYNFYYNIIGYHQ